MSTSQWTLDYPPFFAWFEWLLSHVAAIVDPSIVQVTNLEYSATTCIYFQRCSVIITELVLCYAVIEFCRFREGICISKHDLVKLVVSFQLLVNYGLFIVDHIHFQYNGFLFGILLLSVTRIMQGRHLEGAFLFACLLNLKHLFLYVAPAYFVYLFKHYCFHNDNQKSSEQVYTPRSLSHFRLNRFIILGVMVVAIFAVSFGPFIAMGQLGQVISRLFPFKRGLCHAYWAPNFWALYNIADKVIALAVPYFGLSLHVTTNGTMTSGLVGEMSHQVLPTVSPLATLILTFLAMMPALLKLWFKPSTPQDFLKTLILCAYASFLFGWHVHEKAIMMMTLPMCFLSLENNRMMRIYLLLSVAGHISLFPLLFTSAETPIKVTMYIFFTSLSFLSLPLLLSEDSRPSSSKKDKKSKKQFWLTQAFRSFLLPKLTFMDTIMVAVLVLIQVYCICFHGLFGFLSNFAFLPLLLTSVSCAIVVVWTWVLTLGLDISVMSVIGYKSHTN